MTMVKVKVEGYIMVPSCEADDELAQEEAATQVEAMLEDFGLEGAEITETEITSKTEEPQCDEDALYEEHRDKRWGDAA